MLSRKILVSGEPKKLSGGGERPMWKRGEQGLRCIGDFQKGQELNSHAMEPKTIKLRPKLNSQP